MKLSRTIRSTAAAMALAVAMPLVLAAQGTDAQNPPLTSLKAIHGLNNAQASHQLPVSFQATVTYYRPYEQTLFVQDGDLAIYVRPSVPAHIVPGDRVLIKGTTHESFRPFVAATSIVRVAHGSLPTPLPATFEQLIRAQFDCRLVTVHGTVRNIDLGQSSDVPSISIQMRTESGPIDAVVDSDDIAAVKDLFDDEVEVTGAASGHFDGKMQVTGVLLHVNSLSNVKLVKHSPKEAWNLPFTPMDQILAGYRVHDMTQRVRVHGTITYYQPGSALVLQDGLKSLWILTKSITPLRIGDQADATGFPGVHDGFLTLTGGEVLDRQISTPIPPRSVTWSELATSHHLFDLVSVEGRVVAENRTAAQDEYVLESEGNLFSAIFRHPAPKSLHPTPPPPMKRVALGSKVHVTGICVMGASNPFDTQVPLDILLRSTDDIATIGAPPWLTVSNLLQVVIGLLVIVLIVGAWARTMHHKVRQQTAAIKNQAENEAKNERHNVQLEMKRSRILEDINSSRPLPELIDAITEMVAFSLDWPFSWCEMNDGVRLGNAPTNMQGFRTIHLEIPARAGGSLGTLYAAAESGQPGSSEETPALESGVRLATIAIESRKLYKDLVYRSEFDLLTDIYNRFSLDRALEEQIEKAKQEDSVFGLVYIDLDGFKQVNDVYGHHVGDLYLQEVSLRMKRQLRSGDVLARLGGDEFAALVPVARSRAAIEEIAQRLERCFDAPFAVEGYVLRGGASVGVALYPEDGTSADSLLSAADAAMYVAKHTKRHGAEMPGRLQQALFNPEG
jgi:diguanylate cyclase (GGDEF)-like protein